jgi:WD40 repeat protein
MSLHEKLAQQIVPAPQQALAIRSAALVARGLRDLARESNWLVKKAFSGRSAHLAVSPVGQVCGVSPLVRQGAESLVLYDVELGMALLALSVPGGRSNALPGQPAAFAWSPTGRHLVAAWGGWPRELHAFDVNAKMLLGAFGGFEAFPSAFVWSEAGNYFAVSSSGGSDARVRLWEASAKTGDAMPFATAPAGELTLTECAAWAEWREPFSPEGGAPEDDGATNGASAAGDFDDDATVAGFGRAEFSLDESSLACVVEIEGEWADDSIAILEVPSLRKQSVLHAQGHITDLSWTHDSRHIIFCAAGQASRLAADTMQPEALPFGAELCACHPQLPICVCFSSWLKNSAKGRLFLVDLKRLKIFDEYAAEGVVDLRWSADGSKAYAVTSDGLAYLYEPPLL